MVVLYRHGHDVYTYAKVHTVNGASEGALLTPGEQFVVATLDTAKGDVQVGSLICFDQEFFESARLLGIYGAEIVLKPNACKFDPAIHWRLRARAIENAMAIAMANYAAPAQNGQSVVYGAMGEQLAIAASDEAVLLATVNIAKVRSAQRKRPPPHVQLELCELERLPAFQCPSAFRRASGATV